MQVCVCVCISHSDLLHLCGAVLLECLQVSLPPPDLSLCLLTLLPALLKLGPVLLTQSLVLTASDPRLDQLRLQTGDLSGWVGREGRGERGERGERREGREGREERGILESEKV